MRVLKLLIALTVAFLFIGCASVQTVVNIGKVTTYNADGSILKEWDDVVLETNTSSSTLTSNTIERTSAFKAFGVNFYDSNSNKLIVVSNAVPCIIEYETCVENSKVGNKKRNTARKNKVSVIEPADDGSVDVKMSLIEEYTRLEKDLKLVDTEMKTVDKKSTKYVSLKEKKTKIKKRLREISSTLYYDYGMETW